MNSASSCSFDSSGGEFATGYCIWEFSEQSQDPILVACHCKEGFKCGDPPDIAPDEFYDGMRVKHACISNFAGDATQQKGRS